MINVNKMNYDQNAIKKNIQKLNLRFNENSFTDIKILATLLK